MNSQKSYRYKDYPNQPYISLERNLKEWEKYPDRFHYGLVSKHNMELLSEGLFAGDVIMLWRMSFNNFTNQSVIPQYFEYRYGINSSESIEKLITLGYTKIDSYSNSLELYNANELKRLLRKKDLKLQGNKKALLERVLENYREKELSEYLDSLRYAITSKGSDILEKYQDIIQRHGPKG